MGIDEAIQRQFKTAQAAAKFQSPTINTVDDIRRALVNLDPSTKLNGKSEDVNISARLAGSDGSVTRTFRVDTITVTKSYRQIIIEALKVVQNREKTQEKIAAIHPYVDVNDRAMVPPPVITTKSRMYVDGIIERLLGAYRDGIYICWDLPDGTYQYDVFAHKLVRIPKTTE